MSHNNGEVPLCIPSQVPNVLVFLADGACVSALFLILEDSVKFLPLAIVAAGVDTEAPGLPR